MTFTIQPREPIREHAEVTYLEHGVDGAERNPYPVGTMLHAAWATDFQRAVLSDEYEGSTT